MKTNKKIWFSLVLLTLAIGLTFNSCKKEDDDKTVTPVTISENDLIAQQSNDEEDFQKASDNADDVADDVMGSIGFGTKDAYIRTPCDATVDTSLFSTQKQITITFNGTNCIGNNVIRNGKIILKLTNGNRWIDLGAVLTVTYVDFSILRNLKTIVVNGVKTHTNVTGGRLYMLQNGQTITHKVVSTNMKCTINKVERTWNVNRVKTFAKTNNVVSLTLSGEGAASTYTTLVTWGVNRNGDNFYTKIQTPIVISSDCTNGPKSGVKIHYVGNKTLTTTFGVDKDGVVVTNGCPTHYKVVWMKNNVESTLIIPYQ